MDLDLPKRLSEMDSFLAVFTGELSTKFLTDLLPFALDCLFKPGALSSFNWIESRLSREADSLPLKACLLDSCEARAIAGKLLS